MKEAVKGKVWNVNQTIFMVILLEDFAVIFFIEDKKIIVSRFVVQAANES